LFIVQVTVTAPAASMAASMTPSEPKFTLLTATRQLAAIVALAVKLGVAFDQPVAVAVQVLVPER
jgi:hypothetical protein